MFFAGQRPRDFVSRALHTVKHLQVDKVWGTMSQGRILRVFFKEIEGNNWMTSFIGVTRVQENHKEGRSLR